MQATDFFQSNTKFYIKFGVFLLIVCAILYMGWRFRKKYEVVANSIK